MQIGFVGLGKMGGNMVQRILRDSDHEVVGWNATGARIEEAVKHGATGASGLEDLVQKLEKPRHVWLMIPAGAPTQDTIDKLLELLDEGDLIIDGGNSRWTDSAANGALLRAERHRVPRRRHLRRRLGPRGGLLHDGRRHRRGVEAARARSSTCSRRRTAGATWAPHGAGHYVKMVHNGVEYGMMQAYAEGFEILHASDYELDMAKIANLWNAGLGRALVAAASCSSARSSRRATTSRRSSGYVEDSGEGRWTVFDAIDKTFPRR